MVTEPACQGKEEVSVQISMEAAKYTGGKGFSIDSHFYIK